MCRVSSSRRRCVFHFYLTTDEPWLIDPDAEGQSNQHGPVMKRLTDGFHDLQFYHEINVDGEEVLVKREHWANARDAESVYEAMKAAWSKRMDAEVRNGRRKPAQQVLTTDDAKVAIDSLLKNHRPAAPRRSALTRSSGEAQYEKQTRVQMRLRQMSKTRVEEDFDEETCHDMDEDEIKPEDDDISGEKQSKRQAEWEQQKEKLERDEAVALRAAQEANAEKMRLNKLVDEAREEQQRAEEQQESVRRAEQQEELRQQEAEERAQAQFEQEEERLKSELERAELERAELELQEARERGQRQEEAERQRRELEERERDARDVEERRRLAQEREIADEEEKRRRQEEERKREEEEMRRREAVQKLKEEQERLRKAESQRKQTKRGGGASKEGRAAAATRGSKEEAAGRGGTTA